jgi:hypothetical protein
MFTRLESVLLAFKSGVSGVESTNGILDGYSRGHLQYEVLNLYQQITRRAE